MWGVSAGRQQFSRDAITSAEGGAVCMALQVAGQVLDLLAVRPGRLPDTACRVIARVHEAPVRVA